MQRVVRGLAVALPPLLFIAGVVLLWEFWVREREVAEYLVPRPSAVWDALEVTRGDTRLRRGSR